MQKILLSTYINSNLIYSHYKVLHAFPQQHILIVFIPLTTKVPQKLHKKRDIQASLQPLFLSSVAFALFIHLCQLRRLVTCAEQRPPNIQARNSCLYAPNRLAAYTSTKTVTKQKHPLIPRPVQSIQNLSITYHLTNKTSYCEK